MTTVIFIVLFFYKYIKKYLKKYIFLTLSYQIDIKNQYKNIILNKK
jgi:hypothetical protein